MQAAFAPYTAAIGRPAAPLTQDYRAPINCGEVYVLDDGAGELVGVAVFHRETRCLFLDVLAVLPERQGRGVGGRLLKAVEDRAALEGCDEVRLYTNAVMEMSLMFYEARGYVEVSRGVSDGYHRIFLQKSLDAAAPVRPSEHS